MFCLQISCYKLYISVSNFILLNNYMVFMKKFFSHVVVFMNFFSYVVISMVTRLQLGTKHGIYDCMTTNGH